MDIIVFLQPKATAFEMSHTPTYIQTHTHTHTYIHINAHILDSDGDIVWKFSILELERWEGHFPNLNAVESEFFSFCFLCGRSTRTLSWDGFLANKNSICSNPLDCKDYIMTV